MNTTSIILLLDPSSRAGRTGRCLKVKDAKRLRMEARHLLGTSHEDTPDVRDLLRAACRVSALLYDATEGDAKLSVEMSDGEHWHPAEVLGTL